jgi:hypothetical protein
VDGLALDVFELGGPRRCDAESYIIYSHPAGWRVDDSVYAAPCAAMQCVLI